MESFTGFSFSQFRRFSYLEGFFFALMVATSESYTLYYFIRQGLSTTESALLTTFPLVIASLVQLFCPRLIKDAGVGRGLLIFLFIQIIGLSFITYNVWHPELGASYVLGGLCLYWIGAQNASPLWLDWTSRYVPYCDFHHFLGKRNTLITTATLVTGLTTSLFIGQVTLFRYLFIAGLIARCLSFCTQAWMIHKFSGLEMSGKTKKFSTPHSLEIHPLSKIILIFFVWIAIYRFAVSLCSPFFLTHMVHELKLLPYEYIFLINVPLIGKMFCLSNWARAGRGKRSFWGMQISVLLISFLPSLWSFNSNYWYLVTAQIFSGVLWAGHEISNTLMVQETNYARARSLVALNQALVNICCLAGSLLGAQILGEQHNYHRLFTLSTLGRLLVALLFIAYVQRFPLVRLRLRILKAYLWVALGLPKIHKNKKPFFSFGRKIIAKNQ